MIIFYYFFFIHYYFLTRHRTLNSLSVPFVCSRIAIQRSVFGITFQVGSLHKETRERERKNNTEKSNCPKVCTNLDQNGRVKKK